MELDPKKREKLEKRKWAIHFTNPEAQEKILAALEAHSHKVALVSRFWKNALHQMYNISFAAAEFVIDTFPAGSHGRILLREEHCRGWLVYMENGAGTSSTISRVRANDDLFTRRRRYVPLSKIP